MYRTDEIKNYIIHVLPINDLYEHEEAEWCPCKPKIEENGMLIIHNAFDNREVIEETKSILKEAQKCQ